MEVPRGRERPWRRRAGAGAASAAKEKSGFAATCSLLSRYMKEKKGGALQGLVGLDMSPPAAVVVGEGTP